MKTQIQHFYSSQFSVAADMHERMAEMQRAAGMHRLADASKQTAMARRISAANADMAPADCLAYGEWAAQTVKANS